MAQKQTEDIAWHFTEYLQEWFEGGDPTEMANLALSMIKDIIAHNPAIKKSMIEDDYDICKEFEIV